MTIHANSFTGEVILTSKVGQTDLVFGLWSESISRSAHTRLEVSIFIIKIVHKVYVCAMCSHCSGYNLFHHPG